MLRGKKKKIEPTVRLARQSNHPVAGLTAGYHFPVQFTGPDQNSDQWPVGPADPVRFLKPWEIHIYLSGFDTLSPNIYTVSDLQV